MPKFVSARAAKFADRMKFKRGKIMSVMRSRTVPYVAVVPQRRKRSYGQNGPEVKFLDTASGATSNTTAVVTPLNLLAQGLTNITRIGNKIHIISVDMVLRFQGSPTELVDPNWTRWAIILDKEPEAAAAASYNQIYMTNSPYAFHNPDYSDRFVTLATGDLMIEGSNQVTAVGWNQSGAPRVTRNFRKCDINCKYIGTGATQASVGSNQLLFVCLQETTDTSSSWTANCRIRYTDE